MKDFSISWVEVFLAFVVNITQKRHGIRSGEDLSPDTLHILDDSILTLQIVTGVVCSMYNPSGLFCPFTVHFKILLKDS